jgi:K+-sensing histidine kinase KdpD
MALPADLFPDHEFQLEPQQLAQLVQISVTLNSTLDPDELLRYIMGAAAHLLDCEAASILLYDDKRGQLQFITASGSDPNQLALIPVPLESSIAGAIFRENRPQIVPDVRNDPRHYASVSQQINFSPRSLLGVPMRIRDQVTGVLEALNKWHGEFSDIDVYLLSVIASQAAVAIQNARLVQELQKAYDELSRLDKIKSDFLAIASHELRTPLGVILGYATFLKDESDGELSEHANVVLNSALRLRSLVEEMTNLNLLQVGSAKLDLRPTVIQTVIQAAFNEIAPAAEVKGQVMTHSMPADPMLVSADGVKLERVFSNLLNNAVRFTPEGGQIRVEAANKHQEIWVNITDNGAGIPMDEVETIFRGFYQVEDHMRRRHGGMGLGLAIARAVVNLHSGRIWAESEGSNKGTTIHVVLPELTERQ